MCKFVNDMAKMRSKTKLEKAQGSPSRNSFLFNMVPSWQMKATDFVKKIQLFALIYDLLLLIAKWRVCFKIHSFWKKVGRPWRPHTRNIVPVICHHNYIIIYLPWKSR